MKENINWLMWCASGRLEMVYMGTKLHWTNMTILNNMCLR